MSELASRPMLLFSLQRALLGAVHPCLRQASIEADTLRRVIRLRFEYAEADEKAQEDCAVAATEVIADFPDPWTLGDQHVVVPFPTALAPLAHIAYLRAEPAEKP